MGASERHFQAVAGTLMLMKKRQMPLFQGSQHRAKAWRSQRPVFELTGKRVQLMRLLSFFYWLVWGVGVFLFMTPVCSSLLMNRWSWLNKSRPAFGVRTRRHAGYCRAVCGFGGFGSSMRETQNSILRVWPSKLIALMESANVSQTSGLSMKRVWVADCFVISSPFPWSVCDRRWWSVLVDTVN